MLCAEQIAILRGPDGAAMPERQAYRQYSVEFAWESAGFVG
jgi:hypothetical protein